MENIDLFSELIFILRRMESKSLFTRLAKTLEPKEGEVDLVLLLELLAKSAKSNGLTLETLAGAVQHDLVDIFFQGLAEKKVDKGLLSKACGKIDTALDFFPFTSQLLPVKEQAEQWQHILRDELNLEDKLFPENCLIVPLSGVNVQMIIPSLRDYEATHFATHFAYNRIATVFEAGDFMAIKIKFGKKPDHFDNFLGCCLWISHRHLMDQATLGRVVLAYHFQEKYQILTIEGPTDLSLEILGSPDEKSHERMIRFPTYITT